MEQCDCWLNAVLLELIDDVVVELNTLLADRAASNATRDQPAPADGHPVINNTHSNPQQLCQLRHAAVAMDESAFKSCPDVKRHHPRQYAAGTSCWAVECAVSTEPQVLLT